MKELKNKKILITGGAGFIGSHLCEKLIELGVHVICFDNFFTGKKENILHLVDNDKFILIEGDANNIDDLKNLFNNHKFDYVFHYAAILGVKRVEENPLLVMDDIRGIREICRLAKEQGVKKIVFSSSSEAYGDSAELPLRENNGMSHSENTHLYALVKIIGERIMKIYNDKFDLPTCSLRFFNVFGPRQESSAYGFVVGIFIKQIMKNEAPTIMGDGFQTRDFIYIDDNIDLAIKALLNKKTDGEIINIGVGRQTAIVDLAERLIRVSGKKLKLKFLPERKYEIRYRSPDISKMHRLLGKIKDKLDENLQVTYNSYKK
ncbi:MAG: NAD-dependent epimerase/dehydratase family protein [Patescibacteria group bacterium]|nr:NAD-dependent epimerase/dehydratase family protein [Patescibacteria group bacterium]